jgi:hypothetical protein
MFGVTTMRNYAIDLPVKRWFFQLSFGTCSRTVGRLNPQRLAQKIGASITAPGFRGRERHSGRQTRGLARAGSGVESSTMLRRSKDSLNTRDATADNRRDGSSACRTARDFKNLEYSPKMMRRESSTRPPCWESAGIPAEWAEVGRTPSTNPAICSISSMTQVALGHSRRSMR